MGDFNIKSSMNDLCVLPSDFSDRYLISGDLYPLERTFECSLLLEPTWVRV